MGWAKQQDGVGEARGWKVAQLLGVAVVKIFVCVKNNIIHYQIISILDFVDSALIIVLYITTKNTIMTTSSVYERYI